MAHLILVDEPVNDGEWKMLDVLSKSLPSHWHIVASLQVSVGRRTREIDAVVIGDNMVWAIDAKAFDGEIAGDEHEWILSSGVRYRRVLDNILHAASIVKGKITKNNPELTYAWVEGIIIITGNSVSLSIDDERIKRHVILLADADSYFRSAARTERHARLLESDRESILCALIGRSALEVLRGAERKAFLRLDSKPDFRRIYYKDVVIDRNELRGALSGPAFEKLEGLALRVEMINGEVFVTDLHGKVNSRIGTKQLQTGQRTCLKNGKSTIYIGDLKITATVATLG